MSYYENIHKNIEKKEQNIGSNASSKLKFVVTIRPPANKKIRKNIKISLD